MSILTVLSDAVTPAALYHELAAASDVAFLLESAEGDARLARYSIIGIEPRLVVAFQDRRVTVCDLHRQTERQTQTDDPLRFLCEILEREQAQVADQMPTLPPMLPFKGGFVGYLGYGATACLAGIPIQTAIPYAAPDGCFGLYDTFVVFDHLYRKLHIVSYGGEAIVEQIYERVCRRTPLPPLRDATASLRSRDVFADAETSLDDAAFGALVERCRAYITAGEVFQIVPSRRFSRRISATPFTVYRSLVALNPSPYAYCLKFGRFTGTPGFTYVGSSPETFVTVRQGSITLRALAGTRPRGETPEEDEALARALCADEKELAEHRMLVDLARNDVGRVAQVGTVATGEVARLVRYTHVMHLATDVTGQLRPGLTAFDVIRSCFPRGTVTGAPKIRAMELLATLEPERRGLYAGMVGYVDFAGQADSAIAIRSALMQDGIAHINAGAGVVFDSQPQLEAEETRNKARSVLTALYLAEQQTLPPTRHSTHEGPSAPV
ncbi:MULTISPECIES: anthranilate synthase component I family protein [Chloracidobacterium]|uniref:Anthranilate synthase component 1 n=1 Tax=Chloracidobacterium thermophilum (strain B) TaxID=981222 RepID=G2LK15_CHLTF|nr:MULTISPECIES: anthranilate synthase component I family protein [Chloracidobacterium]AEP13182.1 Anthranilate/para-aminobenzoate synthases component I [Chloracidobacterium thermophilum B]QUV80470.1 anthranilate synthase component I family protein [Chloracidobacterium thermophilum]QUV83026.1 anthranilate synthase component I family protein [Chloracidobacterium sp. D]